MNEAVISVESNRNVIYMNPVAEEIVSRSKDDAIGKDIMSLIKIYDSASGEYLIDPFANVLSTGVPVINKNHSVLINAGNMERNIVYDIIRVEEKKGISPTALLIIRESPEIPADRRDLKNMLDFTRKELDSFVYIASHDLQEPLRMVSSYVHLLSTKYEGRLDKDADEFIGYALGGVDKMKQILNDLLTYSRLNQGSGEKSSIDCNELLGNLEENFRSRKNQRAFIIYYSSLPVISCYADQLMQLFYHLIDNSLKFNKSKKPQISITASRGNGEWSFSVKDNGLGIDECYSDKVFTIFQRLHSDEYDGRGVGMALSKKIVSNHDGRIWYESKPGNGACFHFTIPFE